MSIIKKILNQYVYQVWNIAIADIADDLTPVNIKWMKHRYKDRWFADPFIIDETDDCFIILVEEFMHSTRLGRLARLTVTKKECNLVRNDTILDISTHLSFPNPIVVEGEIYIYPENSKGGETKLYTYGDVLTQCGLLSEQPLADATITKQGDMYYMFATIGKDCNGSKLVIYASTEPLNGYKKVQEFHFSDNIARRAGNVFTWHGKQISPAQICNGGYGKGISFQELNVVNGRVELKEIKRLFPPTKDYAEGFHTYNVYHNKVIIDGYRYGSKFLHNLYFKIRS